MVSGMNHGVQAAAARRNAFQPKLGAAVCMQQQVMKLPQHYEVATYRDAYLSL